MEQTTNTKSPGQAAYEADCAACPIYHDGGKRPAWEGLSEIARWSWERSPSPRPHMADRYASYLAALGA
jgi:hypothetical protein